MTGRRLPLQSEASALIAALDGATLPGACEWCDATVEIRAAADGPNVHEATVSHEPGCPWLAARIPAPFKRRPERPEGTPE